MSYWCICLKSPSQLLSFSCCQEHFRIHFLKASFLPAILSIHHPDRTSSQRYPSAAAVLQLRLDLPESHSASQLWSSYFYRLGCTKKRCLTGSDWILQHVRPSLFLLVHDHCFSLRTHVCGAYKTTGTISCRELSLFL